MWLASLLSGWPWTLHIDYMMEKVERKFTEINMPPYAICRSCRNSLVDVCVEECAPAGDCRHFDLKEGVNLPDLPRFPLQEFLHQLPAKVRQLVAAVYLAKIVDELQGIEDYPKFVTYKTKRRQVASLMMAITGLTQPDNDQASTSPNGAKGSQA